MPQYPPAIMSLQQALSPRRVTDIDLPEEPPALPPRPVNYNRPQLPVLPDNLDESRVAPLLGKDERGIDLQRRVVLIERVRPTLLGFERLGALAGAGVSACAEGCTHALQSRLRLGAAGLHAARFLE